jgi:WD40 repeat protein
MASGAADGAVRFWAPDGSPAGSLDVGHGEVWALAWSPDGKVLATGSMTGTINPTVQLWRPDGTLIASMGTQYTGGKFYNLLWSPDGTRLLGGAVDYKVWGADGSEVAHLPSCQHCTPSWAAAWATDSQTFVIGDENGSLGIYDRNGKLIERRNRSDDINAAAFSPDGKLLAAGRDVWRTDGTHLAGINGRINSLAWSPDSHYLAAAAGSVINILNSEGEHLAVLRDHQTAVNVVAWSPVGPVLASASDDMTVRLWNLP